jgi:hypothetical protein
MNVLKKTIYGGAAALAVLAGVSWGAAAANAATFADTSVQAHAFHSDAIASVSGVLDSSPVLSPSPQNLPITVSSHITFSETGGTGPFSWSVVSGANAVPNVALAFSGSVLGAVVSGPVTLSAPVNVTVKVSDADGAAAVGVLTFAPSTSGHVNLSLITDTVSLNFPFNNNSTGAVEYSTVPAGATVSESNLPPGLVSGNPLVPGSAVPGPYGHVTVIAKDGAGATAVQEDGILVKGSPVHTPPPHADKPYVFHGKWTSRTASTATASWDESTTGDWMTSQNNGDGKCEEVYITGPGFAPLGDFADAHIGFTCDNGAGHNTGYLRGLLPDHNYALRIVPATGDYGHHQPIPGAGTGFVDVFTLADF